MNHKYPKQPPERISSPFLSQVFFSFFPPQPLFSRWILVGAVAASTPADGRRSFFPCSQLPHLAFEQLPALASKPLTALGLNSCLGGEANALSLSMLVSLDDSLIPRILTWWYGLMMHVFNIQFLLWFHVGLMLLRAHALILLP